MRTSVLREIGYFRSELPHTADFELWMRVATASDIGYVRSADQAYYRVHENNMHHSAFDVILADVSNRLCAFDAMFAERSGLLADADLMRSAAHRALAREALGHAISAYARGVADREPIDDYASFALKAWPDAKRFREWRALCQLRTGRRKGLRWDPSLTVREVTRNMRFSLRWWRRRLVGID